MRIRHLSIQNFRGIQKLDWALPKTNLICLIGRGDSTKSSILDAIRFALFPTWNPSFEEFDWKVLRNSTKNILKAAQAPQRLDGVT